jgi:hypothetical protein
MKINLPFVAHLRDHLLGYMAPRMTSRNFSTEVSEEDGPLFGDRMVRAEARMFFEQRIDVASLRGDRARADAAMRHARERAIRAIAHQVYGPIEQELRSVLALLWEEGLHDTPAVKRIDALIPVLRGERGSE